MPDTVPTPNRFGNRTAVIAAAVAGFAVGAGGLAAALHDPGAELDASVEVAATVGTTDDTAASTTADTTPDSTADTTPDSTDDTTPDSTDDTAANTADTTADSVDDDSSDDSTPGSSTPNTIDDDSSDDSTPDSSTPNTIDDDSSDDSTPDSSTPNSVAAPAPATFVETFASAGGSVTVRWDGIRLTIVSISPAAGFHAEIEDQAWDRVRVDFEGDRDDARVEVRISDGRMRVRID